MGGSIGWSASEVRQASLAELWACWIGYGRTQGWLRENDAEPMSRGRLAELMEKFPDREAA